MNRFSMMLPGNIRPSPVRDGYHASNGQFWVRGEITDRTAANLGRDLLACAGSSVSITVDSPGGLLPAGIRIADAVREHGQVTAILKRADSAALGFCAAQTVRAVAGQDYLLHTPTIQIPHSVAVSGPEMREAVADMESNFTALSRCFNRRISDGLFRLLASEDRRLTADEMVTYGLADSVTRAPTPGPSDENDDDANLKAEIAEGVKAAIARALGKRP